MAYKQEYLCNLVAVGSLQLGNRLVLSIASLVCQVVKRSVELVMDLTVQPEESEPRPSAVEKEAEDASQSQPDKIPDEKSTVDSNASHFLPSTSEAKPDDEEDIDRRSQARTSSVMKEEDNKELKTEDAVESESSTHQGKNAELAELSNSNDDSEKIIPEVIASKAAPVDSSGPTSSRTSSMTTSVADPAKQMNTRQKATILVLCFINLLKYMDRFTIAGKRTL